MPNLNIRESLERAIRIFQERPEPAQRKAAPATATLVEGLQCQITGPHGEKIISDMPRELGGGGAGSHPGWFLRAALASCTGTAIAMRAALLGIQLKTLEVTVESQSHLRGSSGMDDSIPRGMLSLRTHVKIGGEGENMTKFAYRLETKQAKDPDYPCNGKNFIEAVKNASY